LVAACPSGAMANVHTYLARANVALSVTLTAVSCLAAVLTGMGIRRRWPDITKQNGPGLLGLNIATLAALLGFIIVQEAEQFATALADIVVAATLLTVLAFGAGWATGWACGARATDRFTVGMVFAVRNVGIATAIAVTVLGRVEFAVFATAYILAQVPLLLAAVVVFRRVRIADGSIAAGTNHP